MPRSRRVVKERRDYTVAHAVQLRVGSDLFNDAFGDLFDRDGNERREVLRKMKAAWPVLRERVMEADRRHRGLFHRPWAWWRFDRRVADPPRDVDEQKRYLLNHNLLTAEEQSALP